MRGSNVLFSDVFNEGNETAPRLKKGRSAALIARRNACLVDRYYWYGRYSEKRYTLILESLSDEFFLSTVTIPEIINDNIDQLRGLKAKNPTAKQLATKWPHLNW